MARECSICTHPRRAEIDQAIARGDAHRAIARQFGVSRHALDRHTKNGHIAQQIAKAEEKRKIADADKLLGIVEGLLSECLRMVTDAQVGDEGTKLRAVREARETAKLLLEVQGELAANPVINITLIETQLNDIRALVLGDLCPVCQAVVAERLKARKQQREIPCQ